MVERYAAHVACTDEAALQWGRVLRMSAYDALAALNFAAAFRALHRLKPSGAILVRFRKRVSGSG